MFKQDIIDSFHTLLLAEAAINSSILGARIGDIAKTTFPDVSIKSEYGSVRRFVQNHFSTILEPSGRQGVDTIYSFLPPIEQSLDESAYTQVHSAPSVNVVAEVRNTPHHASTSLKSSQVADARLREAIKQSIDLMTQEQLRLLVIPAGIFFDAINKTNRL
jgi:hypothetical protein